MKKILAFILSIIFLFSLSACGFGTNKDTNGKSKDNIVSSTKDSTEEKLISRDRAIELALGQEGIKKENAIDLDAELEREAGNTYWEVDFDWGNFEYSYVIDAKTEEILRSHKERRD